MDAYDVTTEEYDDKKHAREWFSDAVSHGRAHEQGPYEVETWRTGDGLLHREDGPALTARSAKTGNVVAEGWYSRGRLHRDGDMPATIWMTGFLHREWYQRGLHHRAVGPAILVTTPDGPNRELIYEEIWCREGKRHRVGGPAHLQISDETGVIMSEGWYRDGMRHRVDGPASIVRNEDTGVAYDETWLHNGNEHRTDGGPTFIKRDEDTGEVLAVRGPKTAPGGHTPTP